MASSEVPGGAEGAGDGSHVDAAALRARVADLEARLAASEQRYRQFAEIAMDWFWETDAELRFVRVEKTMTDGAPFWAEAIIGLRRDQLPGVVAGGPEWDAHLADLAARRPYRNFEYEIDLGGERRWVSVGGDPMFDAAGTFRGYRGVGHDVTRRRAGEARLATTFEALPDAVALFDPDERLVACNASYRALVGDDGWLKPGMSRRAVLEGAARHLGYDVSRSASVVEERMARLPEGLPAREVRTPDGKTFLLRDRVLPNGDRAVTATDVTALRRGQRLEALGIVAGGMAHDLNNMLMPIGSLIELALDLPPGDPRVGERLARALVATERAQALVGRVLEAGSHPSPRLARRDLVEVLDALVPLVAVGLPASLLIVLSGESGPIAVACDENALHQVLLNLVRNAAQAIGDRPGRIELALAVDGAAREAVLRVADDGAGMDPGTLGRIFDPFFTTKRTGEGTGLGLVLVQGIVEAHGGSIAVESQPGAGTAFTIRLPLAD